MRFEPQILELEEIGSTQEMAAELVRLEDKRTSIVFAHHQLAGRGRFGRQWMSTRGDSLTMSLIFWSYPDWNKPWLLGMATSIATARTLGCQVRWPNDVSFGNLKTGGILTEIFQTGRNERIAVVGVGINLLQDEFPPELPQATSVYLQTGRARGALETAGEIASELAQLPEPRDWNDIEPLWREIDATRGKLYRTRDGEEVTAIGVGADGSLIAERNGVREVILAADAIFG